MPHPMQAVSPAPSRRFRSPSRPRRQSVAQAAKEADVHNSWASGGETLLDWLDGPRAGRNLCVRAPDWVIDEALKRASDMMSERAVGTSTISGLPGGYELRFLENAIGAIMRV